MADAVEIRKSDDGTIDEIVAHGCDLHIEQMTADGWHIGVQAKDGTYWMFWMGSRNHRAAVDIHHTETCPETDV